MPCLSTLGSASAGLEAYLLGSSVQQALQKLAAPILAHTRIDPENVDPSSAALAVKGG